MLFSTIEKLNNIIIASSEMPVYLFGHPGYLMREYVDTVPTIYAVPTWTLTDRLPEYLAM